VYVDEVGMEQYLYREYARAPRGVRVEGIVSGRKYKRTSVVAAQRAGKIIAPLAYEGTTNSMLFEHWFEKVLLPELGAGHVIVMDNASFHRKAELARIAKCVGCRMLYLPAYSPDLNPIEHFWAWLKSRLRDSLSSFDSFDSALMACFQFG